jgi:hypothetical protein
VLWNVSEKQSLSCNQIFIDPTAMRNRAV